MGRQKNQSLEGMNKAVTGFDPLLKKYRKLKMQDREKLLQILFADVFENRINAALFEYGKEKIKSLFKHIAKQSTPPESVILKIFEKEFVYLNKNKTRIPPSFLSLVSMNLINELIKKEKQFSDKERLLKVVQRIHDLTEVGHEDFKDTEINKKIPLEVIDHILKRAEYDLGLKALIYRAEKNRLEFNFETYAAFSLNEWPYYIYHRQHQADTLFQYLYFMNSFKLNSGIDKKSAYPPKRTVALECIQSIRKNSDSTGKIYTEIQAILDPDHSSNHSIST